MLTLSDTFAQRLASRDIKPALFFDLAIGDNTYYLTDAAEDVVMDGNTYIASPDILATSYPRQDSQTRRKLWSIQLAEPSASPDEAERYRYLLENRSGSFSWDIGESVSHEFRSLPAAWLDSPGEVIPRRLAIANDGRVDIDTSLTPPITLGPEAFTDFASIQQLSAGVRMSYDTTSPFTANGRPITDDWFNNSNATFVGVQFRQDTHEHRLFVTGVAPNDPIFDYTMNIVVVWLGVEYLFQGTLQYLNANEITFLTTDMTEAQRTANVAAMRTTVLPTGSQVTVRLHLNPLANRPVGETQLSDLVVPSIRARINLGPDQFVASMMTRNDTRLTRAASTSGQQFHAMITATQPTAQSIEFYYAPPQWAERFREVGLGRCTLIVKVALANEDDTELSDTVQLYRGTLGDITTQDRGEEGIVTQAQFTGPFVKLDNQHGRYMTTQSQRQIDPNDTGFDFIHIGEGEDEWEV